MRNKKDYFKEYEFLDEELPDLCNRFNCASDKAKDIYFIVNIDGYLRYQIDLYSLDLYSFDDIVYDERLNGKECILGRKLCDNCLIEFLHGNKEEAIIIPEEKIYLYKILG